MAHRRYYSPFENSVRVDPPRVAPPAPPPVRRQVKKFRAPRIPTLSYSLKNSSRGFFDGIQADDLIIIGLIMLLLFEDKEERDMPLIVGLGALLLSGFWDT